MNKQRLISGITISGDLTVAHYLVVIKQLQKIAATQSEFFLFVADLHAVTTPFSPVVLVQRREAALATFYALGFKPTQIFVQSDIEAHSLLYFLLARYAFVGELNRMTQFKSKQNHHGQLVGLFTYPLLMAADILLYDANVLVGPDQKQHVELTRNLALRINNFYKQPLFHVPNLIAFHPQYRIRDLQLPTQKMSKSTLNKKGTLFLTDSPAVIRQKLQRAVTDSENRIAFDFTKQPGVANLILLYALASDLTPETAEKKLKTLPNYFALKELVAEALITHLTPLQDKLTAIKKSPTKLHRWRQLGAKNARKLATTKLTQLAKVWGFDWS